MLARTRAVAGRSSALLRASAGRASSEPASGNSVAGAAAIGVAGVAILGAVASCSDDHIPAPDYPFEHKGMLAAFDKAAVRRGYQVYREVCSTCHSVDFLCYRNLVGVIYSEEKMKRHIADIEVEDGPDAEGEMFERPAKLSDPIPRPYANEEAARAANNGALPPDLSMVSKARPQGADYIFALLTGYVDAPEGKTILPGLHYNPYFAGGAIAMEQQLNDGQIDYEDGTPATASQMAKDVAVFLAWASEPESDERKKAGMKWIGCIAIAAAMAGYYKRFRWSPLKTRKIHWTK
mmetsp:Transcript_12424/g.24656  ORF Transcript_12424/g.24656 Transcript_12424/m.24656 type:complete len:293 (-) Transcript_12424:14-892(-)